MLTYERFKPDHFDNFEPGDPDRELCEVRDLEAMLQAYPTLTIFRDGVPHVLIGVIPLLDFRLSRPGGAWRVDTFAVPHLWSMWSKDARRRPFAFCRWLRRHIWRLLREHGADTAVALTTRDEEEYLAEFLGMRRVSSDRWVY